MKKNETERWMRNCPKCNIELYYARRWGMVVGNKNNSICKSCASTGRMHSNETKVRQSEAKLGKIRVPFTDEWKQNLSNSRKCYTHSAETKLKISNGNKGKVVSDETKLRIGKASLGRIPNNETKMKIRKSVLKNIENRCGKVFPNYNPFSIPILEAKANELGITDLQHAENGGEYHIKELGYFVDGYSKEKNIVLEYYEKFHNLQVVRDLQRQTEIIDLLGCVFIIINE